MLKLHDFASCPDEKAGSPNPAFWTCLKMEAERIPAGPTHGGVEIALGDAHEPRQLEPDDLVRALQHRNDVVQAPLPHLRSVHLDELRGYKRNS